MEEAIFPTCSVRVMNDRTNDMVYFGTKDFNIAELQAVKLSNKIFIDQRYLEIENLIFDYDYKVLEIHVNY